MKTFIKLVYTLLLLFSSISANALEYLEKYLVSDDIQVYQISTHCFVHVSVTRSPIFGKYTSNGLICINNGKAFLFDSPSNDSLTQVLVTWISTSLHAEVVSFLATHWHVDRMGGLNYLNQSGINTYASKRTAEAARVNQLPDAKNIFSDSLILKEGDLTMHCYFPGEAHTTDNIVVNVPKENVLFPACIIKELSSRNLGNTKDGNIAAYATTVKTIINKFPGYKIVIPGHGQWGGADLLQHTLELAEPQVKK